MTDDIKKPNVQTNPKRNIWVTSDTHFGHANIIRYCSRPFLGADEMNKALVQFWNETVHDQDIVYHLGDVYMGATSRWVLPLLKGRKRLILGNHDDGKDVYLQENFQKIMVWRMFVGFRLLLTHVPVHETSLHPDKCPVNVHGHVHNNMVRPISNFYENVCVEVTDYRPVNIETLRVK